MPSMDTSQKRARERRKIEKRQEKEARRRERTEAKLHPISEGSSGESEGTSTEPPAEGDDIPSPAAARNQPQPGLRPEEERA